MLFRSGIDKEVTLVGAGSHFDIWDTTRRENLLASIDLDALLYS